MKKLTLVLFLLGVSLHSLAQASAYKYFRVGNTLDVATQAAPGYALMGGGKDLDEAFQFLCEKAPGGDFLIVRAAGDDDYNPYVRDLCKLNSVATLLIPSREAANDPQVAKIIGQAEAVFIAGGDQARYINWWQHSPVEKALNAHVAAGKPIGGTSAGLAVLGEFVYSSQGDAPDDPDLTSVLALANPYMKRVTVRKDFLKIDLLRNTLTDSHFAKRDRMGRTLTFLARIVEDGWSEEPREIAIDERSSVLVEADGKARVVGPGKGAYFLQVQQKPSECREGTPLSFADVAVYHAPRGSDFDLKNWSGHGGMSYSLSVDKGVVHSTQSGGEIY